MLNPVAKLLLALSATSGVATIGYGIAVGDRAGALLLAGACAVSLMAALAVLGAVGALEPLADDDELAAAHTGVVTPVAAPPSVWPLVAGLAVAAVAGGVAVGAELVLAGLIVGLIALGGWLAQVWREYPGWSPRLSERMDDRLLLPAGLPLLAFGLAAAIAIAVSRILLAVPKDPAVVVALVVAVVILFACAVLAARPRVSGGAVAGLAVVAALLTGGAGVVGAAAGEREFHEHAHTEEVHVEAENLVFNVDEIKAEAGEARHLAFENHDDVYHNVAVYEGQDEPGAPIFNGRPVVEGEVEYEVTIEEPGTYLFICDFHPQTMTGAYVVE